MKPARSFASDNNAGVHPKIIQAIFAVNQGHTVGYGDDAYTKSALAKFREHFGRNTETFVVFNGTAANVLSFAALTSPYHAVICAEAAHIYVDECGAPEKLTGCKLIPVPTVAGKLTVEAVHKAYHGVGDQHHVQPRVISITQSTEVGTVYKHDHKMFLHVDGARIANAAASLKLNLRQATRDLGVDVLSFGGTKNGAMGAEAVVFFNQNLAHDFLYRRKQGMQLASKMRYISAQLDALLTDDLWLRNARHSNRMAKLLERELKKIPDVEIAYKVEANGVFARIPRQAISKIRQRYFFYDWDESQAMVRWMCSWDTTEQDVTTFVRFVAQTIGN
jgi:threonine aldolase